ncbi:MAG: GntR family transcriptional regulator [Parvibaculaceae bacterium]
MIKPAKLSDLSPDRSPKSETKGFLKLERETLNDRAYREIKRAIIAGAITPGSSMTIRGLAQAFGTSPMPVREALNRLVSERVLQLLPNRSVTLPLMTAERFREICRIRILLEGEMVETGAQLVDPEELAVLDNLNQEMHRMKPRDSIRYLAANQDFHFALCRTARMPLAMSIIESLWVQAGPFLHFGINELALKHGMEYHSAAVEAMRRRNGKAARAAVTRDISDAADEISRHLQKTAQD